MMSFPEFKKLIGPLANTMTDAEIEKLRELEYRFADVVFDWWLRKRNNPEQPSDGGSQ